MGLINHFFAPSGGPRWQGRMRNGASWLMRFAALTAAYAAAAQLSLTFAVPPGVVSPLWLPSAIGLWACLAWDWRVAPAIGAGAAIGIAPLALPPAATFMIAAGCMLEALAGAALIRHLYPARSDFVHRGSAFRFIAIALGVSTIGAITGTTGLMLSGTAPSGALASAWLTWWLGSATGTVVGVPLLFAWNVGTGIDWRARKILEIAAFALTLTLAAASIFGGIFGNRPLAYVVIPFFLWAAIRLNLAAVAWTTAIIAVTAAWNTAHGNGPFAGAGMNTSLPLLMSYIAVVASMGLVIANLVYQRISVESLLREERDGREQHVLIRTHTLVSDIEERKRIERKLAAREQQLAEAQRLAQIGSWNWDIDSNEITWSDELYRIFGVDRDSFEITPENIQLLMEPDDLATLRRLENACKDSGFPFRAEYRIQLADGSVRTVAARGTGQRDETGRVIRLVGTVQDITEAKRAEASLREAEERYRMVVELSPDAILVQQDGVFVYANPAALRMFKAERMEDIIYKSVFDFLHPDFHALVRQRIADLRRGEKLNPVEERFFRLDGSEVDVEVSSSPFPHQGKFATLFIMRDITERKKTVEQMAYLAHYDSLTGLPNRTLFHQRLEHALTIAERPGRSLEIMFLDLDRFKNINDTLGHAAGDLVLKEAALRLQGILRESDTVARLGGDEFVVLVENVDEPHRGSIIAEKILAAFVPPFMRDREPLSVSTSIGISSFPSDGTDADSLLKKADIAMYRAKEMGRNSYCYFSEEMNLHATERLALESGLARAIDLNQFSLHYQPKIDILTNRISGMEALLRWNHPVMGPVAPHRFIPVAEESGLIQSIGYWTLRTACAQNRRWQLTSPVRLRVAVNLSTKQLADTRLIDNIDSILAETGLEPQYLEIEVKENTVMTDPERMIGVLNKLHDRGISIAIDDFGVGNSSLAYLKRFPIRAVKIDRSFVQGIPLNHGDSAIAKAIIILAHSLECSVIAEGAETQQQFDFLRDNECDSVQGFYFSAPMPAEHFEDLIRVQSKLHLH